MLTRACGLACAERNEPDTPRFEAPRSERLGTGLPPEWKSFSFPSGADRYNCFEFRMLDDQHAPAQRMQKTVEATKLRPAGRSIEGKYATAYTSYE